MENENEPYTFLTYDSSSAEKEEYEGWGSGIAVTISLSEQKKTYERSAYTFLTLAGDIGGLFGAIAGIPAIFMTYFAERLFHMAIAELLPIKKRAKSNTLHEKLTSGQRPAGEALTAKQVDILA